MVFKIIGGFIIAMIVLFNIVSDNDVTNWLNYIWVAFWLILFALFFFVAPSERSKIKKRDKES